MQVGNIVNNKQRPVNLDLHSIRFPITAIASILHRVSGVISFIALALLLGLLAKSLDSPEGFMTVSGWLDSFFVKFCLWVIFAVFGYHLVVGIRHIIMDFGYWEDLPTAALSAKISFVIAALLAVLIGGLLW